MKAVVCQNGQLQVEDLPEPVPAGGQVLLAVERCGICGSDLHMRHHCDEFRQMLGKVGFSHVLPSASDRVVFGHELCAEVLDYGPGSAPDLRAPGFDVGARLDASKAGSGLGLAISRDLARLYGGELEL